MDLISNLKSELTEMERKSKIIKNMIYELKDGIEPEFNGISLEMEISIRLNDLDVAIDIINGYMEIHKRRVN